MNCMKVCEEQCISYWLSKLPLQLSSLKTTNIHYFIVPVNQESGSSLVGCPWLRVFHEVIVKLLPGAAVISRLDRVWRIYFKAHSRGPLCRLFTCQLAVSHPLPGSDLRPSAQEGRQRLFITWSQDWRTIMSAVFYLRKVSHEAQPTQGEKIAYVRGY